MSSPCGNCEVGSSQRPCDVIIGRNAPTGDVGHCRWSGSPRARGCDRYVRRRRSADGKARCDQQHDHSRFRRPRGDSATRLPEESALARNLAPWHRNVCAAEACTGRRVSSSPLASHRVGARPTRREPSSSRRKSTCNLQRDHSPAHSTRSGTVPLHGDLLAERQPRYAVLAAREGRRSSHGSLDSVLTYRHGSRCHGARTSSGWRLPLSARKRRRNSADWTSPPLHPSALLVVTEEGGPGATPHGR
jgi:hypothetical protein